MSQHLAMNAALLKALKESVSETFLQIAGTEAVFEKEIPSKELNIFGDISSLINLVQESTEGSLILCFEKETIFSIIEKIYRIRLTEINKSVSSSVSELANITYGVLKKKLNQQGYSLKMSLPHVIVGDKHNITGEDVGDVLELHYSLQGLKFRCILTVKKPN